MQTLEAWCIAGWPAVRRRACKVVVPAQGVCVVLTMLLTCNVVAATGSHITHACHNLG
jgi:hypothetical protein